MYGQRGRIPDDATRMRPTDPWARTAPLDAEPYPDDAYPPPPHRYAPAPAPETYDEDHDETLASGRRMRPLAIAGMVCAIVISIGLVVVLLSPVFSDKSAATKAPNLPGLLEEPPGATLAPQPATEAPVPTETPAPTPPASPTPTRAATATGNAAVEDAVVALVNSLRRRVNCDPVQTDRRLREAARQHSADMAAGRFLSHTGSDGSSADDRMKAAGYDAPLSENLARGFRSARDVVRGWLNSQEQRQNMLNCDARAIGVGVAVDAGGTPYWTQDFGR